MTRSTRRRALLAAAIACAALAVGAGAAQAATYTVAAGGGTCGGADTSCESLVAAAGAVALGDTVNVAPGTYEGAPNFAVGGVQIHGSTDAPGVIITGTVTFSGGGATPSVLDHVIVAPSTLASPAVGVSGSAGVAVRDSFLISGGGSGMAISNGAGNEITRSSVFSGAPDGKAVDVQASTAPVGLILSSSILSGGANGTGLSVTTSNALIPGAAGAVTVAGKHVTIAGAANATSLDSSRALGLLTAVGSITATISDSILLGSNPTAHNAGLLLVPANTATLNVVRTDQTSTADALFADAAKHNYHLRPDSPAIDKGQVTSGDSATDIDGQPRTAGAASDLGADEFVNTVPTAAFVVKTPAPHSNQPVTFDASASTDREGGIGGGIVQYQWSFGDGATETTTAPTITHTYPKDGTVVVSLVVIDRQGAPSVASTLPVKLTDGTPPSVVITKLKSGQVVSLVTKTTKTVTKGAKKTKKTTRKRTRLSFTGTAKDPSGVSAVFLTLERISVAPKKKTTTTKKAKSAAAKTTASKRCIWLDPKTGFVDKQCAKPVLIRTGVRQGAWAYRLATRIKPVAGVYRLSVYGTDGAGAFGNSAPASSRVVKFTLR